VSRPEPVPHAEQRWLAALSVLPDPFCVVELGVLAMLQMQQVQCWLPDKAPWVMMRSGTTFGSLQYFWWGINKCDTLTHCRAVMAQLEPVVTRQFFRICS
jgi:hypothetical protein